MAYGLCGLLSANNVSISVVFRLFCCVSLLLFVRNRSVLSCAGFIRYNCAKTGFGHESGSVTPRLDPFLLTCRC